MGTLDEIRRMQQEGRQDQEIVSTLKDYGIPDSEINESLAQAKIKQAIGAPPVLEEEQPRIISSSQSKTQGMQPSMLAKEEPLDTPENQLSPQQQNSPQQAQYPPTYQEEQANPQYQEYPQYESYQPYGAAADTISEIAEQIFSEKISPIKNKLDSILDIKTLTETKINYLDERLKRIEKIIDRLELSILQKVGEYTNNVEDIKNEVIETQKSFKSLLQQKGSYKQLE